MTLSIPLERTSARGKVHRKSCTLKTCMQFASVLPSTCFGKLQVVIFAGEGAKCFYLENLPTTICVAQIFLNSQIIKRASQFLVFGKKIKEKNR